MLFATAGPPSVARETTHPMLIRLKEKKMSDSAATYFVHPSAVVDLPLHHRRGDKDLAFSAYLPGRCHRSRLHPWGQNVFVASTAVVGKSGDSE